MFENMFENIGRKIKSLAVIDFVLGSILCIIAGLALIIQSDRYNPTATAGFIVLIAGPLVFWISSFCLYGFGELIEKTCENNALLQQMEKNQITAPDNTKISPEKGESPANNSFSVEGIVCPACNTTQPSFRTKCWTCGAPLQPKNTSEKHPVNRQNAWMSCPACGSMQRNTRESCTDCGALFEHDQT